MKTHLSLNSRHILSLGTFSLFDMSFLRFSTVLLDSMLIKKSPPVVGLTWTFIRVSGPHPCEMGLLVVSGKFSIVLYAN